MAEEGGVTGSRSGYRPGEVEQLQVMCVDQWPGMRQCESVDG